MANPGLRTCELILLIHPRPRPSPLLYASVYSNHPGFILVECRFFSQYGAGTDVEPVGQPVFWVVFDICPDSLQFQFVTYDVIMEPVLQYRCAGRTAQHVNPFGYDRFDPGHER